MPNVLHNKPQNPWKYLKHLKLAATPLVKKGNIMISTEEEVDLSQIDAQEEAKIVNALQGLPEFKHANAHRLKEVAALIEAAI